MSKHPTLPSLSVIIPQHGQSGLTIAAVRSLLEHHRDPPEILVVDDASSLRQRRVLQAARLSEVQVVPLNRRAGVTAAWNLGARQARGEILVFLNNDTLSAGEWLSGLVRPILDQKARMTGLPLRREAHLPDPLRKRLGDRLLPGWCFALRRDRFKELGGFDGQLRLYFSDTDLQCRLLVRPQASIPALVPVPGLPLTHLGHRSTRRLAARSRQWRRDHERFLGKWTGSSRRGP